MLNERKLTKSELNKREDIIKDMKKNKRALVKKYGKDAEQVMYGRATNIAKKQAESMNQDKLREMIKDSLQNPKAADLNKDGKLSDYEEKRGAAIEKSMEKKNLKEDWGGSDQSAMNASIHRDLGNPTEFPGLTQIMRAAEEAVDFYWDDWDEYETDRDGLIMHAAQLYANKMFPEFMAGMRRMMEPLDEKYANHPVQIQLRTKNAKSKKDVKEDFDLGHQDNEPHMLKADLYRIGKYAMELYQMVDQFEGQGEVDFPHWWQSKISNAKAAIVGAKHYLDFELKEPQIDAMVDVAAEEEAIDENSAFQKRLAKLAADEKAKRDENPGYAAAGKELGKVDFEDFFKKGQSYQEFKKRLDKLEEGTWSVGTSSQIKKVMDLLDKAMDIKDPQALISMLEKSSKVMYNVVGDDLFFDDIDGAKSEAKEGNMDRAQNRLSDAYSRAEYFLERQMDREGIKEEAVNTRHIEDHEYMAAKIQKAMNDLDKSSEDYESKLYRLQQARKANNKGDFKMAMKIMKPFLAETSTSSIAEKLAKQLKNK